MRVLWGIGALGLALLSFALIKKHKANNSTAAGPEYGPPPLSATNTPLTVPETNALPDPNAGVFAIASNMNAWRKGATHFTPEEHRVFAKKFAAELKPAVERWSRAYAGHVPFDPSELSISNFVERLGFKASFMSYTFVMGDNTIGVRQMNGETAVNYIASRKGMVTINQLPGDGTAPSVNTPITREEIIQMVKADTGTEFQPSEIEIRPTGAATALGGGAFVNIGHLGGDPNNGLCKLDFVFGPDGKIINYNRSPNF